MPKPKAQRWLTEAFRDGVDEAYGDVCILGMLDPLQKPCTERLERFHWIGRQRVEASVGYMCLEMRWQELSEVLGGQPLPDWEEVVNLREELPLLAAWDSRNGAKSCEVHHRRFDGHLTPELKVPGDMLPAPFLDFVYDWGLEIELERNFPLGELVHIDDLPAQSL